MATGRYVLQHRAIPTTDVLSYTSPGAPWIYPPFAGVLFYLLHRAAGPDAPERAEGSELSPFLRSRVG